MNGKMNLKTTIYLVLTLLFSLMKGINMYAQPERPNIVYIMTDDQSSIVPTAEDAQFKFADGNGMGVQSHHTVLRPGSEGKVNMFTDLIPIRILQAKGMLRRILKTFPTDSKLSGK